RVRAGFIGDLRNVVKRKMRSILCPLGVRPQILDRAAKITREAAPLKLGASILFAQKTSSRTFFVKNKFYSSMGCRQSRGTDRHFPCRSVDSSHHFSMKASAPLFANELLSRTAEIAGAGICGRRDARGCDGAGKAGILAVHRLRIAID